jgi:hypothetical protein
MNEKTISAVMAQFGKVGGKATTPAKKRASAANGELGGRPRTMRKCKYPSHRFSPKTGKCYGCGHTRESATLAT